jgi:hypothetical protein
MAYFGTMAHWYPIFARFSSLGKPSPRAHKWYVCGVIPISREASSMVRSPFHFFRNAGTSCLVIAFIFLSVNSNEFLYKL